MDNKAKKRLKEAVKTLLNARRLIDKAIPNVTNRDKFNPIAIGITDYTYQLVKLIQKMSNMIIGG